MGFAAARLRRPAYSLRHGPLRAGGPQPTETLAMNLSACCGGLLAAGLLAAALPAHASRFCGGPVQQSAPNDLEHVVGDLTIEHIAQQPASVVTCAMGYLIAKCGDYETANRVFDKCIAAGYAGAMIWKGLLYENGDGVPQDHAKATQMFRRAAESGNGSYATLGKLHYATALHLGRGVARDEAAARTLFEQAAAEGSEEAQEFLRTGYHTGDRDADGVGAGVRPAWADVAGRGLIEPGLAAEAAARAMAPVAAASAAPAAPAAAVPLRSARRLVVADAAPAAAAPLSPPPAPAAAPAPAVDIATAEIVDAQLREHPVSGVHLARIDSDSAPDGTAGRGAFGLLLAAAFMTGALAQMRSGGRGMAALGGAGA